MGAKLHPLLAYLAKRTQAEDLEAAAVRENGSRPGGKAVQSSVACHKLVARAQIEMVGVAKDDGRAYGLQIVRGNCLDRADCPHGHENGGGNVAVGRVQDTCPCPVVRCHEAQGTSHTLSFRTVGLTRKRASGVFVAQIGTDSKCRDLWLRSRLQDMGQKDTFPAFHLQIPRAARPKRSHMFIQSRGKEGDLFPRGP